MTIEFTNATPPKGQSGLSIALLVLSCMFFFIPATLIVLGYYSSLPTGTLISPIPQGIISNSPSLATQTPIVAEPIQQAAASSSNTSSNSTSKTAVLPPNAVETIVTDPEISENSQIYIINKDNDKSLYNIKSKSNGQFILGSNSPIDSIRNIDYQIVNQ